MTLKFLIVDDEPLARKLIQSHAAKVEVLEEAGVCGSAIEAVNFLRRVQVDLIFLDIQMPELSGLDFIKSLKQTPAIIFTTAYREFAVDAFDIDELKSVIHIKSERKVFPIPLSEIQYIESLDNYVKVHLKDKWLLTHENISSLEKRLPRAMFVRIHRSYLINTKSILSVSAESLQLANLELPFGRAYKQLALQQLGFNIK